MSESWDERKVKMPEFIELEKVENQYGEDICVDGIYLSEGNNGEVAGMFYRETLNCMSCADLGMGTCRCVSHPIWDTDIVSRADVIDLLNDRFESLSFLSSALIAELTNECLDVVVKERFALAGFSTMEELEGALSAAYKLGLNPLPRIRKLLEGLPVEVDFCYPQNDDIPGYEAEKARAIFAVCLFDEGDEEYVRTELFDSYYDDEARVYKQILGSDSK